MKTFIATVCQCNTVICIQNAYKINFVYIRGNAENDWNSSVVRLSPSKAIIGFPKISDYFHCRKCRFPDVGHRRKCQGFCAFRLKHALHNSLSMYFHQLTNIGTINGLMLVFHHYRAGTYIYTFWAVIGRYCHSSADAGTISIHFGNKMNDNARSNLPGLPLSFWWLRTLFLSYSIIISHFLFYVRVYEHIRISLNIIFSIINSWHITYLHCWCFCVLTGVEPGPFILRHQHSTPRLQGTCEGGILVSPRR